MESGADYHRIFKPNSDFYIQILTAPFDNMNGFVALIYYQHIVLFL